VEAIAKIRPAVSGPSTPPAVVAVWVSVFAAGTRPAGTSRGTIACRTGELTANAADCTAVRASSR
jgi:hypothetical protein